MVKAIRGATTVQNDTEEEILSETELLIKKMMSNNNIETNDLISIIFSVTDDLTTQYPSKAVRKLGYTQVPLMNFCEPKIKNSIEKCIRVMIMFETDKKLNEIKHIYCNNAVHLRPDLNLED